MNSGWVLFYAIFIKITTYEFNHKFANFVILQNTISGLNIKLKKFVDDQMKKRIWLPYVMMNNI